jgi:hypothetical protein
MASKVVGTMLMTPPPNKQDICLDASLSSCHRSHANFVSVEMFPLLLHLARANETLLTE